MIEGKPLLAESWTSRLPSRLGEFDLLEPIGRGGVGAVFRARQRSLNRVVAVKVVMIQEQESRSERVRREDVRRFNRERYAFSGLHHTNILPVFSSGEEFVPGDQPGSAPPEPNLYWYAMTLVPGASLARVIGQVSASGVSSSSIADVIRQATSSDLTSSADPKVLTHSGPPRTLSPEWIRAVAQCVQRLAEAVHHIHQNGWVHWDLKPANIMLEENEHPWVIDFGLARRRVAAEEPAEEVDRLASTIIGDDSTNLSLESTTIAGTPSYMAPEQFLQAPADPRTDVFALGEILHEMLTLRIPFPGGWKEKGAPQYAWKLASMNSVAAGIPEDLEAICRKAMQRQMTDRYGSAAELAKDLSRFLNAQEVSVRRWTMSQRFRHWQRRRPATAAVSALAVFLIPVIAVFAAIHNARLQAAYFEANQHVTTMSQVTRELQNLAQLINQPDGQQEFIARLRHTESLLRPICEQRPDIVDARITLAGVLRDLSGTANNADEQERLINESIAIQKELLQRTNLTDFQRQALVIEFADSLNSHGVDLRSTGRYDEADACYLQALDRLQTTEFSEEKKKAENSKIRIQLNRSVLLEGLGKLDDSLKLIQNVVTVRERITSEDPQNTDKLSDYANSVYRQGSVRLEIARATDAIDATIVAEAEQDLARAMELLKTCVSQAPDSLPHSKRLLVVVLANAELQQALDHPDRAQVLIEVHLDLAQSTADRTGLWSDLYELATYHARLAEICRIQQQPLLQPKVTQHAKQAIGIMQKLLTMRPNHAGIPMQIKVLEEWLNEAPSNDNAQ